MSDELDLSLPTDEPARKRVPGSLAVLMVCMLAVLVVNLAVTLTRSGGTGGGTSTSTALAPDTRKQLALKLEKQGLEQVAAEAWKEYLGATDLPADDAARIWYRIGKLYQDARDYEKALDSYYRSESFAEVSEIAPEIARRTEQCLESMGKFAALRYELAERVGLNTSSNATGSAVVAEIGPRKITKAELDGMIEAHIQRQIAQFASFLPPEEQKQQKEQMLKQFSTSSQRKAFLRQYIAEEVLSRKARETKLADDASVRAMIEEQERSLLARELIEKQYSDQIKITPGDLQTYYEAHKDEYEQAERAGISHILVAKEADAKTTLDRALGGEDFAGLAKELSQDEATRQKGGKLSGWAEKDGSVPGVGSSPDARALIFGTEAGHVCTNYVKSAKGYHIIKVEERQPETQKPFEEVRQQVFRALREQKETEIQQRLMAELESRYNVVIHESAFAPDAQEQTTK